MTSLESIVYYLVSRRIIRFAVFFFLDLEILATVPASEELAAACRIVSLFSQ